MAEWVSDKFLRSQVGTIQIPARDSGSANQQFSRSSCWNLLLVLVHDIYPRVCNWRTDGRQLLRRPLGPNYTRCGHHRTLRRPVIIYQHERETRRRMMPKRISSRKQKAQASLARPWQLDYDLNKRGGEKADSNAIRDDPVAEEFRRGPDGFINKVDARSGCKVGPQFPDRCVKTGAGMHRGPISRRDRKSTAMP